jgi:catechol 2,3-dioxygenase-like lactoylglutathione lyase family enzyme
MSEVITGLHAVTVHVRDVPRARKFYHEVLGLTELSFDEKANRVVFSLPGCTTLLTMKGEIPGRSQVSCSDTRIPQRPARRFDGAGARSP